MFVVNRSAIDEFVPPPLNVTREATYVSASSAILTIVILSLLSISGWIFMSYALFSRSEAYRIKPNEQFRMSDYGDPSTSNDFVAELDP